MSEHIGDRLRRALACVRPGARIEQVKSYPEAPGIFLVDFAEDTGLQVWLRVPGRSTDLLFTGQGFEVGYARDQIKSLPTLGLWKGFALFDDGTALRLDDPEGLRAFYRRARPPIAPLHLAHLLARYHGLGEVVTDVGELARLNPRPSISSVKEVAPPRVEGSRLWFCTSIVRPGPRGVEGLHLDGWQVRGLDGDLAWEVASLGKLSLSAAR